MKSPNAKSGAHYHDKFNSKRELTVWASSLTEISFTQEREKPLEIPIRNVLDLMTQ